MDMQSNSSSNRQNWVWGGLLILLGLTFLAGQFIHLPMGALTAMLILGGIGFTFFAVFLANRSNRWALIPAYVLWAVAGIVFLSDVLNLGDIVGSFVLYAIAFPFIYVFTRNPQQNRWALIPAYIMGLIGTVVFLSEVFHIDAGPLVLFGIAAPFLYVFVRNPQKNWWALIPGGIIASVGLGVLMASLIGWMVTVAPVVLIGLGLYLLIRNMRGHDETKESQPEMEKIVAQTGQEADKVR